MSVPFGDATFLSLASFPFWLHYFFHLWALWGSCCSLWARTVVSLCGLSEECFDQCQPNSHVLYDRHTHAHACAHTHTVLLWIEESPLVSKAGCMQIVNSDMLLERVLWGQQRLYSWNVCEGLILTLWMKPWEMTESVGFNGKSLICHEKPSSEVVVVIVVVVVT